MLPTKFRIIWPSGFRGEDFQKSINQKQELPVVAMFVYGAILIEDLPQMLPTRFRFIWQSGFRGEDFQKSTNQEQELPVAAMFVNGSGRKLTLFIEDRPQILPSKFRFIWSSGFRGEESQKSTNQEQELPVVAMFVNGSGQNEQSLQRTFHGCFLPSFGSFGKAVSEEKIFLEINQSETRMVCGGHVC